MKEAEEILLSQNLDDGVPSLVEASAAIEESKESPRLASDKNNAEETLC